jgi:dTMP kinase
MSSMGQPRFVVLEGLDGAGTTTQAELLAGVLRARGLRVCLAAEPTDGPLGRVLRSHVRRELTLDPHAAALVFSADRADHLDRVIRPALERGEWVVCDRYLLSTLAYQGAGGVDPAAVLAASRTFEVPDLVIFLDVPLPVLAERLAERTQGAPDRYDDPDFAPRLREAYGRSIELLRRRGDRVEIVDGEAPVDNVLEAVRGRLDALV